MTSHPTDDGFHEIQLNGKQLVFLFMAATVVSVVIFLCGVLVGRGVRAERSAAIAEVPGADPIGLSGIPAEPPIHTVPPPPALSEPASVVNRLEEKNESGLEDVSTLVAAKPQSDPVPSAPRPTPVPVSAPPPAAKPKPVSPSVAKPSQQASTPATTASRPAASGPKSGYVVQLAATNSRSEADAMAKRLSAKGYDAYVQAPADNAPAIFRVRVGNYPTRSEAESAAARLEKEGKFKPWVAAR